MIFGSQPMRLLRAAFICLFGLSNAVLADGILPPARGHFVTTFVMDTKTAPLAIGAKVEFIGETEKNVPKSLRLYATVLGTIDEVVFFETTERTTTALAHKRTQQSVKFRKIGDSPSEFIAERKRSSSAGQTVQLAPYMRTLTVSVDIDQERVERWSRGDRLTFLGVERSSYGNIRGNDDVSVVFVAAKQREASRFELTVIADPRNVEDLVRANLQESLTLSGTTEQGTSKNDLSKRCMIRQMHGGQRISIEIPCPD